MEEPSDEDSGVHLSQYVINEAMSQCSSVCAIIQPRQQQISVCVCGDIKMKISGGFSVDLVEVDTNSEIKI